MLESIQPSLYPSMNWDNVLFNASVSGNLDEFQLALSNSKVDSIFLDYLFKNACVNNRDNIARYLLDSHKVNDPSYGLQAACLNGNEIIIHYCFEHSTNLHDLNEALFNACVYGDVKNIDYILGHGATDYNRGLIGACLGGHKNIILYMLSLGANDIETAKTELELVGFYDLIPILLKKHHNCIIS
jgi:hypothetical protein